MESTFLLCGWVSGFDFAKEKEIPINSKNAVSKLL
jgi:hypothetical protein